MNRSEFPFLKRLSLVFAMLAGGAWLLAAPSVQALSASDQQEVRNFKLTEDFLKRYQAVAAETQSLDDEVDEENDLDSDTATLDELSAQLAASKDKSAILKRHGLSARQVVVGELVMVRAQMADIMLADPQQAQYVDKAKMPSDANMAFYRAHKSDIDDMLDYAGDQD